MTSADYTQQSLLGQPAMANDADPHGRTGRHWGQMPVVSERAGDRVDTPPWIAKDMMAHFAPAGTMLDPCRGNGVFHQLMPGDADWCEIAEGRDFFAYRGRVDWAISNPPYSLTRKWFTHSYQVADNLLYLVPLRNVFSGYGFIREIYQFGGIAQIRLYGTGGMCGFPMGNAIGAIHVKRGYDGETAMTFAQRVAS